MNSFLGKHHLTFIPRPYTETFPIPFSRPKPSRRILEPRNGFTYRGGLEEGVWGGGTMMLIVHIVIPKEDFRWVRALSTAEGRSSLQQEGWGSSLCTFPPHTITSIDLLMGPLQPLDTFSCNFHFLSPHSLPETRPFPNPSPMFSFQLNPGFSNYPVGQCKVVFVYGKSRRNLSSCIYIT